jgi:FKBP-type peptidyl-prolyl cis-trans isomerase SlyD
MELACPRETRVAKSWPMNSAAQVGPDSFVTLAYTLYDEDGDILDRTDDGPPVSYVHGYGQIVPGLERGVEGMVKGDARSVVVSAADGYGDYDPEAVVEVDRHDFPRPDDVSAGDEFIAESDDGEAVSMTVLEVRGDDVVVDTNHPLAGEVLRFEVTVLEVRPATQSEIHEAEHAHGHGAPLVTLGKKRSAEQPPS